MPEPAALLLIALGALLQGIFIRKDAQRRYIQAAVLKALASACFVALGLVGAFMPPRIPSSLLICLGLLLGMVGDILHALRFIPKKGMDEEGAKAWKKKLFTVGAAFFAAGHFCYISYLLSLVRHPVSALVVTALVLAIIFWRLSKSVHERSLFALAGAAYIAIVGITCGFSVAAFLGMPSLEQALFAFGGISFLASDTLLVLNSFGERHTQAMRTWSLVLYYAAQTLIALSIWP
ncbi:MAG: lysoplasmalogenase family protein [Atopobiaceae bacterium]